MQSKVSPKRVALIGKTIDHGRYEIIRVIGEGGMGAVYRARHKVAAIAERQGGDVALKVMHPQYTQHPELRERFMREAELCLKLTHPNIVRVFDVIEEHKSLGLVMELIEGRELSSLIGEVMGPIPWPKAQRYFFQILEAIGYAHAQGIVHRDLKPENVLIPTDGRVRVVDFGLAYALDPEAREETSTSGSGGGGKIHGTPAYMAPEQWAGEVTPTTDVWAIGLILHELISGNRPYPDSPSLAASSTSFKVSLI